MGQQILQMTSNSDVDNEEKRQSIRGETHRIKSYNEFKMLVQIN